MACVCPSTCGLEEVPELRVTVEWSQVGVPVHPDTVALALAERLTEASDRFRRFPQQRRDARPPQRVQSQQVR